MKADQKTKEPVSIQEMSQTQTAHARIHKWRTWSPVPHTPPPPPLKNHKNIGFLSNTSPDSPKYSPAKHQLNGVSLAGRIPQNNPRHREEETYLTSSHTIAKTQKVKEPAHSS